VATEDLSLKSEPLSLICRGSVDFKGNLDFYVFSQFSEETIAQSDSLKKTITALLTQTGDYLTIRLTGTLAEPHYVVVPSSVDVIEKAKDLLIEGLQNIFE